MERLERLAPGMAIIHGGDQVVRVPDALAAAFRPGDRLVVVQDTGDLLHIPAAEAELVATAVGRATEAFQALAGIDDDQITAFYESFAARLEDDPTFALIAGANDADVATARAAGR